MHVLVAAEIHVLQDAVVAEVLALLLALRVVVLSAQYPALYLVVTPVKLFVLRNVVMYALVAALVAALLVVIQ